MSQMPPPQNFTPGYATPGAGGQKLPAGMAIAAMVLGIISCVSSCAWYVSLPTGLIGVILGAVAGGKAKRGEAGGAGMAKAGLICGIIGMILGVVFAILFFASISLFRQSLNQAIKQQQQLQQQRSQPTPPSQMFHLPVSL